MLRTVNIALNWIQLLVIRICCTLVFLHVNEVINIAIITVKGYMRKGAILLALKEPVKAMQAYEKALEIDPENQVRSRTRTLDTTEYMHVLYLVLV